MNVYIYTATTYIRIYIGIYILIHMIDIYTRKFLFIQILFDVNLNFIQFDFLEEIDDEESTSRKSV